MDKQNSQITVTFDSNVWESIVDPAKRVNNPTYEAIFNTITSSNIRPFFFEGVATIEIVPKANRIDHFPNSRPRITMKIGDNPTRVIEGTAAPKLSDYLSANLPLALDLGFRFIRLPRIGLPIVPEEFWAKDEFFTLEDRLERSFNFSQHIESLGMGRAKMDHKTRDILEYRAMGTRLADKKILPRAYAKAVAEWADGDALAAHYGYGINYFCTNDRGRSAGTESVFSASNLNELVQRFSLKIVDPDELIVVMHNTKR